MISAAPNELDEASALMESGQLARAREVVARLKGRPGATALVWALASEISLRLGLIDDALAELDEAVRLEPRDPRRHAQRARCAILAGRSDEARASVTLAIRHGVSRVDDLLLLASVLVRCDDQSAALDLYRRAERIAPERAEVQRGLATVYRFVGELELGSVRQASSRSATRSRSRRPRKIAHG